MTASHKRAVSKRARIDRDFPHQVALPDIMCCMENNETLMAFCDELGVDYGTRTVTAVWSPMVQRRYRLYCFPTREAAETFARHFDGIYFNPKRDRKNGSSAGAWHRSDDPTMPERCGQLCVPMFFRERP
jgi:hypothetical protein